MIRTWVLRATTWALLGGWLGSWGLFAFVIAPTAFEVLFARGLAGDMVAPVLTDLNRFGIAAGLALAVLAALRRQGWLLVAWPLVLAALCAASEYGITPRINEVQPHSFGPDLEQAAAQRFSDLHQLSRYVFGIVGLGVLGLLAVHARPEPPATPQADT